MTASRREFNFQIRDELKKMTEFKSVSKTWPLWLITEKKETVTVEMFIDMIVYNSEGDMELARKGLMASKQYLDSLNYLDFYYYEACNLLFEIWRNGFMSSKCVLDWHDDDDDDDDEKDPYYEEVERVVVGILNNVQLSSSAKRHWIKLRIKAYKERSSLYHRTWQLQKIFRSKTT